MSDSRCTCESGVDNFCLYPSATLGCPMTFPGGYCDPNGDGSPSDADWVRGYFDYQSHCVGKNADRPVCQPGVDNFCLYPVSTLGHGMTFPGGYCDPNGDGSPSDADWVRGYFAYQQACVGPQVGACSCQSGVNNFCLYPTSTLGCGMTFPGGYCDPNGDGSTADADWTRGYFEFARLCGTSEAEIRHFSVTPQTVDRGGTVTVRWEVAAGQAVSVWRLAPGGPIADFFPNPWPSGTWTLALPTYHVDYATFMLFAQGASGELKSATATVQVRCPYVYFFGTPEFEACPFAPASTEPAEFQPFEHGVMISRPSPKLIYVLFENGHASRHADTWTPGWTPPAWQPPAGTVAPEGRFAKVWAENANVSAGLGWGTASASSYAQTTQVSGAFTYARTYVSLPDGRVVYLVEDTWGFAN